MHTKLQNLRLVYRRQITAVCIVVLLFCAIIASLLAGKGATAATATTINFQARLMNAAGAIAPDGNYNIEFKLYDTASGGGTAQGVCTGNCKWVETRTGAAAHRCGRIPQGDPALAADLVRTALQHHPLDDDAARRALRRVRTTRVAGRGCQSVLRDGAELIGPARRAGE